MRKNHTLTFNETTYIINDGKITNSIFFNGLETDWYIEYDSETLENEVIPQGIRLKNRNDEDTTQFYLYLNTTQLQFHDVVYIIKTIQEESFTNK